MSSRFPGQIAGEARRLMASGDLQRADLLLQEALGRAPEMPELLYLRGVIASRRQDFSAALALLQAALAARPAMAAAWLAIGHVHMRLGRGAEAEHAYERAAACEPDSADVHFNLGVARRQHGDLPGAARAFYSAWQRNALMSDAAKACVSTLAAWVRSTGGAAPPLAPAVVPMPSRTVSVIVCSVDDAKAAHTEALYQRLLTGMPHEIIILRDAVSLAEAYNRALDRATGEVIVLSHDDIDILAPDFAARLCRHLCDYDVLGVVGATRMTGPLPIWAGHPHVRGWITHHLPGNDTWDVDLLDPRPVAGDVIVLDGVLLAARREVFASVRFDAVTFDGFHGYDIDWSYRAALAGFRLAATGDLRVVHASRGRYDDVWLRYAERFCGKHRTGHTDPSPTPYYETRFASQVQVESFYARLMHFAADEAPGA
jgi:hypothetical protein